MHISGVTSTTFHVVALLAIIFRIITSYSSHSTIQKFGVCMIFLMLKFNVNLFDQKYNKNSDIVKC